VQKVAGFIQLKLSSSRGLSSCTDKGTLPQSRSGHPHAPVVTGFEVMPVVFACFNTNPILTLKKRDKMLFVHDHNKNPSFAESLKCQFGSGRDKQTREA